MSNKPLGHVVGERRDLALGRHVLDQPHRQRLEVRVVTARLQEARGRRSPTASGSPGRPRRKSKATARQVGRQVVGELGGPARRTRRSSGCRSRSAAADRSAAGALENLDHLVGVDARGQRHREHRAGGQPHVHVEVGDLAVDEEVVEGLEAAHLEGAAGDGAPGQHQCDARVALSRTAGALSDQGESQGSIPRSLRFVGRLRRASLQSLHSARRRFRLSRSCGPIAGRAGSRCTASEYFRPGRKSSRKICRETAFISSPWKPRAIPVATAGTTPASWRSALNRAVSKRMRTRKLAPPRAPKHGSPDP